MMELEEVGRASSLREADQLALVLAAMGIASRLERGVEGVALWTAAADAAAARRQLAAYERENAPRPVRSTPLRPGREAWHGAVAYALLLLLIFGAQRRDLWSLGWLDAGAALAGPIQAGDWWRTVTALTLHVDHGHLLGNLLAGAVIGTLAAQLLGQGLAWLAILLAGAVGNLAAALLHAPDHAAIGASTAVFAALGIVSAYTRQRRWLERHLRLRRLAPLGAGVLLLANLGFGGERTDVGAHLTGFAAGLTVGWALARWSEFVPRSQRAQRVYGGLIVALIAVAWGLAFGIN